MKKTLFLVSALSGLIISSVATAATANSTYDGKITFMGKIVDNTCTVTTATNNLTVTLPTVSKNSFAALGDTAGTTAFKIGLENCKSANAAQNGSTVRLFFIPKDVASYNQAYHVLNNTSTDTNKATNVGIQILTPSSKPIPVGEDISSYSSLDDKQNLALKVFFDYFARYFALDANVGAGPVQAEVEYTIAYD